MRVSNLTDFVKQRRVWWPEIDMDSPKGLISKSPACESFLGLLSYRCPAPPLHIGYNERMLFLTRRFEWKTTLPTHSCCFLNFPGAAKGSSTTIQLQLLDLQVLCPLFTLEENCPPSGLTTIKRTKKVSPRAEKECPPSSDV
ncbi:hypothetical protein Adt_19095 [Abeliophyllum distichum]|uniref:Uncharacterized protein n=1 Tax=Abeliophyllum distichum TaxID=126358 RepID=A0ABD1STI4_9LAMI